jgi:ABC-type glutathione transport system ATPase component
LQQEPELDGGSTTQRAGYQRRIFYWWKIKDALDIHEIGSSGDKMQEVLRMLDHVGLTRPEMFYEVPAPLSVGQRRHASKKAKTWS